MNSIKKGNINMNIEKLEQELREQLRKINIEFSIKKNPKFNLKECLNFYRKRFTIYYRDAKKNNS